MRCHYEVLGVERTACDDEIKKSYRKLALQWHPDKNRDNEQAATDQFRLVQQAYDVLSERHERAWYDTHRDRILRAGLDREYDGQCVDIFPYFSASCYCGFGDDHKGFYSVYRELFNKIAAEDLEFVDGSSSDTDYNIPDFGSSSSDFAEVVGPFYGYWQSYCTRRSFAWLDQHDIRQAPNRFVLRQMEKDNKKTRLKAKKERNDQVRALVAFVRRRDERVSAQRRLLQLKALANSDKQLALREEQRLQRLQLLDQYEEAEWNCSAQHEQQLLEMEANMARQFGDVGDECGAHGDNSGDSDGQSESDDDDSSLYCPACDRMFKTQKSLHNHERSKRHRDNMTLLRAALAADQRQLNGAPSSVASNDCHHHHQQQQQQQRVASETNQGCQSIEPRVTDGGADCDGGGAGGAGGAGGGGGGGGKQQSKRQQRRQRHWNKLISAVHVDTDDTASESAADDVPPAAAAAAAAAAFSDLGNNSGNSSGGGGNSICGGGGKSGGGGRVSLTLNTGTSQSVHCTQTNGTATAAAAATTTTTTALDGVNYQATTTTTTTTIIENDRANGYDCVCNNTNGGVGVRARGKTRRKRDKTGAKAGTGADCSSGKQLQNCHSHADIEHNTLSPGSVSSLCNDAADSSSSGHGRAVHKNNNNSCSNDSNNSCSDRVVLACRVCRAEFVSKNKLFDHIKSAGHATVQQQSAAVAAAAAAASTRFTSGKQNGAKRRNKR